MARFEDLLRSLWDPGDPHGTQPPLTGRAVAEAEHALGVTLPGSLEALLRRQNGGVVAAARDAFPTSAPTSWSADHVPFEFVMAIGRSGPARTTRRQGPPVGTGGPCLCVVQGYLSR
ncbi:hypothetical protein ABZ479_04515 [Streptomyces sp. NPDC005722]